jgi:lysine-specific demethylase 8/hypoxia-inducible factor 1-alpha inhibitor (HIF hydroxylase)
MNTPDLDSNTNSMNREERMMEIGSVPRVSIHDLNPKRFEREFKIPGQPVVITDALESAIPLDLDKLVNVVGEVEVPVRVYGAKRFSRPKTEWKSYCEMRVMSVRQYCTHIKDDSAKLEHMYLALVEMGHTALRSLVGPCIDLIARNTGLQQDFPNDINLWVGPGGHLEPLHHDGMDGTLSQFRGTKRVTLFSPGQTKNLYPFPMSHGKMPPTFSQPYIDAPDFAQFPRLREALKNRIVIILAEGETLFMPVGWWHEIEAVQSDYICSINRFWKVAPIWRYKQSPRAAMFQLISSYLKFKSKYLSHS